MIINFSKWVSST